MACAAWDRVVAAFGQAERSGSAWGRAHAALGLFAADGRLNDRAQAASEIAAALPELSRPGRSKVRNFLKEPRSLSFLYRMDRRLEVAEPRRSWRAAMAWRWWLRHGRPEAADPIVEAFRSAGWSSALGPEERRSYDRVAAMLRGTVRASHAVECMNRVLRMQQSRHRRMMQAMLDLKRLNWNCRPFRSGPRKDTCPYRALGLALPAFSFRTLLHTDSTR